ncbi:MAG: SPOR domain-containing protein [Ferruginibacter sp.]
MKKIIIATLLLCAAFAVQAQTTVPVKKTVTDKPAVVPADTVVTGKVTVVRDARLDILGKKEAEFNAVSALGPRAAKGYRLMVLNSNDRNYAMRVRGQLLQNFPDQKVYMSFQAPFIKLKFGNFLDKDDAEKMKKQLVAQKIVTNNIYVVPDVIEVKPDKNKEGDTE